MNRQIIGPEFSSAMFTWTPVKDVLGGGTFSTEMSMFNGQRSPLSQVWNDSADAGFVMVSAKTGKRVLFTLTETKRDRDGDTIHWEFKPTFSSVRANPKMQHVVVRVFNT